MQVQHRRRLRLASVDSFKRIFVIPETISSCGVSSSSETTTKTVSILSLSAQHRNRFADGKAWKLTWLLHLFRTCLYRTCLYETIWLSCVMVLYVLFRFQVKHITVKVYFFDHILLPENHHSLFFNIIWLLAQLVRLDSYPSGSSNSCCSWINHVLKG